MWLACGVVARAQEMPALPPGVKLLDEGKLARGLAPGYRVAGVEVDWTHPLLQVTALASGEMLDDAAQTSDAVGLNWQRVAGRKPEALMLQLLEPRLAETTYSLPLTLQLPEDAQAEAVAMNQRNAAKLRDLPHVLLGGSFPWRMAGPTLAEEPERNRMPEAGPMRAQFAARWVGRLDDLKQMGNVKFDERLGLSLTEPNETVTRFLLLWREDGRVGQTDDCRKWLAALGDGQALLGVHATGRQVRIGEGEWRLGPAADPRRVERLGGVLALRGAAAGEAVDWGRMRGATWQASSAERDFPASALGSGGWAAPVQNASLWISRAAATGRESEMPWCAVTFTPPRPIERVVLYWASAVGWDAEFNPGEAKIIVKGVGSSPLEENKIQAGIGPVSIVKLIGTEPVRELRVEFPQPERQPGPDARARVAAMQAWGPWDGSAGRSPQ
jgi:hypothetical protein